jgi:SnoaL-like protein
MSLSALTAFGRRYARAWCSQDPDKVAAFFAEDGSLAVNGGKPAVGRDAIADVARSFMVAFPDLHVSMKGLTREGRGIVFHWSLSGTNTGPGGKGHRVEVDGDEVWRMDADGLIVESQGHFNADDYAYQMEHGVRQPTDEDEDPPVRRGRPPNAAKQRASSEGDGDNLE